MNKVEKKENKLKQFVNKHKLAFTIAGGVVICAASVGLIYLVCRNTTVNTDRIAERIRELAAKDDDVATLVKVCDACDAGTAGTSIMSLAEPATIAECFGEYTEEFLKDSFYKPDDLVANIIFNIAKKPET